jgi:hypothetical protein
VAHAGSDLRPIQAAEILQFGVVQLSSHANILNETGRGRRDESNLWPTLVLGEKRTPE